MDRWANSGGTTRWKTWKENSDFYLGNIRVLWCGWSRFSIWLQLARSGSNASLCRDFFFFSVLLCSCWVGLVWMWVWLSVNDKDVTGAETAVIRALHLCQLQTQKSIWHIYFWLISGHFIIYNTNKNSTLKLHKVVPVLVSIFLTLVIFPAC